MSSRQSPSVGAELNFSACGIDARLALTPSGGNVISDSAVNITDDFLRLQRLDCPR